MEQQLFAHLEKLETCFSHQMREHEEKLQKVAAASTSVHPDIATLTKEFQDFRSFVYQSLSLIRTQLEFVALSIDKHEMAMRRKVLLIHGLPEKPNEELVKSVLSVFSGKMKLTDVQAENIQVCHRLGFSQTSNRPVLVRFTDMECRRSVWDSKTSLKGSGITISEFLTKARHKVFTTARKHFSIKQCWSAEGKIIILLPDKTRRKIESMDELKTLMQKFPSASCPLSESEAEQPDGPEEEPASPKERESASPKEAAPKTAANRKARRRN